MRIPNMRKSAFVLLLFVVASLHNLLAADWNPVADPNAVVVSGKVRFTVLTARMIRIEYSPTSTFEDRATFAVVNRRLPVPRFTQRTEGNYLYIETDSLTLRYKIDNSAHGSTFNYNKLFGLEEKSDTDIRNEREGKETTLDRTRRLLYVTCSRAIYSLAIVYYTSSKDDAYRAILDTGWFKENEIIKL